MTVDTARAATVILLGRGSHDGPDDGLCLLEAAAFVAGEPHSDHPACVSPVLGVFGRSLNDRLDDERRQLLLPMVTRLVGTAGDGRDETRSYLALDWLIRTYTPAWLDLAGLDAPAAALRSLAPITDMISATAARGFVDAARAAAWAAAGDAAWDAAGDAARAAARAVLAPTVAVLQVSAIDLFDRMITATS